MEYSNCFLFSDFLVRTITNHDSSLFRFKVIEIIQNGPVKLDARVIKDPFILKENIDYKPEKKPQVEIQKNQKKVEEKKADGKENKTKPNFGEKVKPIHIVDGNEKKNKKEPPKKPQRYEKIKKINLNDSKKFEGKDDN